MTDQDRKESLRLPKKRSPGRAVERASGKLGLLDELVGFNLRLGYNLAVSLFSRNFSEVDIAPIQFAALEYIARNAGCSQKELARDIGSSPAALVTPLERLERQGWIVRRRLAEDRRRATIDLTPDGARRLAKARVRVQRVDEQLVSELSTTERGQLLRLLRKLRPLDESAPAPVRRQ